jgi:hypothetical protein
VSYGLYASYRGYRRTRDQSLLERPFASEEVFICASLCPRQVLSPLLVDLPPIKISLKAALLLTLALLVSTNVASAGVLINEIMFHPAGLPEPTAQEWIELINPDAVPVNVAGWQFTDGIEFTVPAGTTMASGGYLVVAADKAAFLTAHPGFNAALVVGGWIGRLSNSGEHIEIKDATGIKIDEVTYADEGDWATRARGSAHSQPPRLDVGLRRGWRRQEPRTA